MSGTVGKKTSGAQSGMSRNGSGAVSGLNLPLMPLKPVQSVLYTFQRRSVTRGLGPVTSRLDFCGNLITFLVCPIFTQMINRGHYVCIHYTVGPISSTAELSRLHMSQKRRRHPVIFAITLSTSNRICTIFGILILHEICNKVICS